MSRRRGEVAAGAPAGPAAARSAAGGRVHLFVAVSLDGYLAAPDGGVTWLEPYADARTRFTSFIKTIGAAILGRATYDHAVAAGHADLGLPAYVVTHRPFEPSSRVVAWSGDLAELVASVRLLHDGDIWLMGGGHLTRAFQDANLIDLWSIAVVPTLLGQGRPMFPAGTFDERRLRLTGVARSDSGVVELRYERVRRPGQQARPPSTRSGGA